MKILRKDNSSLSSAIRGDYKLKPLVYGVHHRGNQLVEIVEATSDKYMGKDRSHGKGLIKL